MHPVKETVKACVGEQSFGAGDGDGDGCVCVFAFVCMDPPSHPYVELVTGSAPGSAPSSGSHIYVHVDNDARASPPVPPSRWCSTRRCQWTLAVLAIVGYVALTLNAALVSLLVAEKTKATLSNADTAFEHVNNMYDTFRQLVALVCVEGGPDIPPEIYKILCTPP